MVYVGVRHRKTNLGTLRPLYLSVPSYPIPQSMLGKKRKAL
jgi:hypothetical protein